MNGVERKNVFPYEMSEALLDEKEMEEKERVTEFESWRGERSRYIPPPLSAEHDVNDV